MKAFILFLSLVDSICLGKADISHHDALKSHISFQLPDMKNNTTYDSRHYPNGVFVLEAFFERCPYCNQNAENLDRLAERFLDKPDVQVLDIGIDDKVQSYQAWLRNHQFQVNHKVLNDSHRSILSGPLRTQSFPTTFVVSCDGTILYKHAGLWQSSTRIKVEQAILAGLNKKCK